METLDLLTIPGVLALVEIVKRLGLPVSYAPVAAIVLGVGISMLVQGYAVETIVQGFMLGLSASGLWSGSKTLIKEVSKK